MGIQQVKRLWVQGRTDRARACSLVWWYRKAACKRQQWVSVCHDRVFFLFDLFRNSGVCMDVLRDDDLPASSTVAGVGRSLGWHFGPNVHLARGCGGRSMAVGVLTGNRFLMVRRDWPAQHCCRADFECQSTRPRPAPVLCGSQHSHQRCCRIALPLDCDGEPRWGMNEATAYQSVEKARSWEAPSGTNARFHSWMGNRGRCARRWHSAPLGRVSSRQMGQCH